MTEVPDKFSLTFDKIYLGKGNCENVMHEADSTEELKFNDDLADSYTATVGILSNKGLDCCIESYWDITKIQQCKVSFVNTIIIKLFKIEQMDNFSEYVEYLINSS